MSDVIQDFYAGYEGEPEFLFLLNGHPRLRCWEGHLSAILDTVLPEYGLWTGLAEPYHLDLWGDRPWRVTNNVESLTQLQQARVIDNISADYAREADDVRLALINLFQEAVKTRAQVIVRCD